MPRAHRLARLSRPLALAALLALAATPLCAQDVSKQVEADRGRPKKSTTGAVLRSLALPGWGQYYTKNYWKAAAFVVVQGGILWGISYQNDGMKAYKRSAENYEQLGQQALADDFRRFEYYRRDNRNELFWWLAGMTLLSMGDAYVDAQLYGMDMSPSLSLANGALGVTVSCKF